jgi:hypothetical protein
MKVLMRSIALRALSRSLVIIPLLIAPSFAHAQQQPNLDALASEAATQIYKSVESAGKKILVVDFGIAPHSKANELVVCPG